MYTSGELPDFTKPYESENGSEIPDLRFRLFQRTCVQFSRNIEAQADQKRARWKLWCTSGQACEVHREERWRADVAEEIRVREFHESVYEEQLRDDKKREERRQKRERMLMETEDMEVIGLAAMQL